MLLISRLPPALHVNQLWPAIVTTSTPQDPILDQFQQMGSMISSFLGARQDPTPGPRQSFCNYLHSKIEHLEERDFLTFRNERVKLLSEIQYKEEEYKRQVATTQQVTIFQVPEATQATAYSPCIQDTQPVSIPVVQPSQIAITQPATVIAKVQQPPWPSSSSAAQPASFLVVDAFRWIRTTGRESTQHFWIIQPLRWDPKCATLSEVSTHHNHFHPLNHNQHRHQCHLPLIKNSQDLPASPASRVSPNSRLACIKSHQPALLRATQSFKNNYSAASCSPKTQKAHRPTRTRPPSTL